MTSPEVPELLSFDLTLDELEFVAVGIVYLIERLEFLRDRKQTTALDVQISRGYQLSERLQSGMLSADPALHQEFSLAMFSKEAREAVEKFRRDNT
jgi:hypothetical protein